MKKIIYILAAAAMVQGCNFLDFDETSSLYTREDMYAYFGKAKEMLTNVYGYMPQDFGVVSKAMRDCGCDDAEFGDPNNIVQNFNNGSWTPSSVMDTQWGMYNGVRAANEFIESIGQADFSRFENEPQYENWKKQLEFFPYEARVLRAFYFFELARRYGDIAMPMKMLTPDEANTIGKTPFADVIKFIADECYECSKVLPDDYLDQPDHEFGRVTKGFALAVRSKALLYAASRLHNPSMDKAKWEMSAEAAHDIIALNLYSLDPGAKVNDVDSPEVVLFRMNNNSSTFELDNFPIRFTEGKRTYSCGTYPTQELVDAFQTKNGYDIMFTDVPLQDGSYVCLRNATIGYTFSKKDLNNKLRGLRLYLSGNNLAYIWSKDYKGINPEARMTSGVYDTPMIDGYQRGGFPLTSTVTFGIDLKF